MSISPMEAGQQKLTLSERLFWCYAVLFEGAAQDDLTDDCLTGLSVEILELFELSGLQDTPRPDISDEDLIEFFRSYGNLDSVACDLADLAFVARIEPRHDERT